MLHGSCNAIGGQNAVLKLRWGRPPEELLFQEAPRGIKFALGENPKRSNFTVPGQRRYPATRMGVEVVIREAFREARAYKREWEDYEKTRPRGRGRAPAPAAQPAAGDPARHPRRQGPGARPLLPLGRDPDADPAWPTSSASRSATFQHVLEGYKVASEIARHGAGASTFSDWWAYKIEAWDAIPYNAAVMAAHGVNVSLNSDSNELARRLYWEAAKAVKYGGVSEDEALKMVTLNPAWQLGVERAGGLASRSARTPTSRSSAPIPSRPTRAWR